MSYVDITPKPVQEAAERLKGIAHVTPVFSSRTLDEIVGASVHLKMETLQRSGSFKFRDAYNAIAALPAAVRLHGVATFSSDNHGSRRG